MTQAKYFDVCLIYKPTKKASPFVSVRIYCMRAENKDDAKARALVNVRVGWSPHADHGRCGIVKEFVTLAIAYAVAWPCHYAGYLYETAIQAFAAGRKALKTDVGSTK
jgi:hypothetical protein